MCPVASHVIDQDGYGLAVLEAKGLLAPLEGFKKRSLVIQGSIAIDESTACTHYNPVVNGHAFVVPLDKSVPF